MTELEWVYFEEKSAVGVVEAVLMMRFGVILTMRVGDSEHAKVRMV